jgi:hypothetical protein
VGHLRLGKLTELFFADGKLLSKLDLLFHDKLGFGDKKRLAVADHPQQLDSLMEQVPGPDV